MTTDLGHWQQQHGAAVTLMIGVFSVCLLVCVVYLVYLHFRERRLRKLRRSQYPQRQTRAGKKRRQK